MRKGILLAGGTGTRLYPLTLATNKQLLPVYDKPMIYYSLSTLMKAGIDEILIIVDSEESQQRFQKVLGVGETLGIFIEYAVQDKPRGIADAFLVAEEFIENDPVALALGDNIFVGHQFDVMLPHISENQNVVFGCYVSKPSRYGVVEFKSNSNQVSSIEEKPVNPKSNYAVPGLYFYDNKVVTLAKQLQPSARGELEITDVNNLYISQGKLTCIKLPQGTAWFDAGTQDDLLEASNFVHAIQSRTGVRLGDPLIIAKSNGWL